MRDVFPAVYFSEGSGMRCDECDDFQLIREDRGTE